MPKSKKNRRRKPKSDGPVGTADTVRETSANNNAFQYGNLLIQLILDSVSPFDVLVLRCVNWRARILINRCIFKHVTLQTDTVSGGARVIPVVTETGRRLPAPALTPMSPVDCLDCMVGYLEVYTTVLDVENIDSRILERLNYGSSNYHSVQVLRLKPDQHGYHTYHYLFGSFGASTIVVFPSFHRLISYTDDDEPPILPDGATKVVQHIAFAVDWRGPVLFDTVSTESLSKVTEEVWIMTHAAIDVDYGHFNIWGDRVLEVKEKTHQELMRQMALRLNVGVCLTLVGFGYENLEHDDKIKKLIRGSLPVLKRRKVDLLEFKTWDEYVATLSPKELANEKLPNTYLERWRAFKAEHFGGEPEPASAWLGSDSESEEEEGPFTGF